MERGCAVEKFFASIPTLENKPHRLVVFGNGIRERLLSDRDWVNAKRLDPKKLTIDLILHQE